MASEPQGGVEVDAAACRKGGDGGREFGAVLEGDADEGVDTEKEFDALLWEVDGMRKADLGGK